MSNYCSTEDGFMESKCLCTLRVSMVTTINKHSHGTQEECFQRKICYRNMCESKSKLHRIV